MALIGYYRVSTDHQNTQRQMDALEAAGCIRSFGEKLSGTRKLADRPELMSALDYLREDDTLVVQEVDRLGRNMVDGLVTLGTLFERGVRVRVLEGVAAGEHAERTITLDIALALAEDQRRNIARKTRNGLQAARKQGRVGGRPTVITTDRRHAILGRHNDGESLRQIARGVGVSPGTVHRVLSEAAEEAAEGDHQNQEGDAA